MNNIRVFYFYIVFAIVVLVSCREGRLQEDSYTLRDYKTIPEGFIKGISFVPLDSAATLSTVRGCLCVGDNYFVHALNGLFKFNIDGSFVKQISRKGRAEHEWIGLETFFYSSKNNELCLIDCPSSKIMHYSLDGDFLYSTIVKTLDKRHVSHAVEVGNGILMSGSIFNDYNEIYMYLPYGEGEEIVELKTLPFKSDNIIFEVGRSPISVYQDTVKCIVPFDNKLYTLSDGKIVSQSTIPTGFSLPGKDFYRKYRNSYHPAEMTVECIQNNKFCGYDGIYETDDWIVLSGGVLFTVIEKITGDCWILDGYAISNKNGFPLSSIYCAAGNTLISIINRDLLQMIYENVPKYSNYSDRVKELLTGELEDNPVIVRYELCSTI